MSEFMKALSSLPQIVEAIKKMKQEEIEHFVGQLGLDGEDKEYAQRILTSFQQGKELSLPEQIAAQKLLNKALEMGSMDLTSVLGLLGTKHTY